MSEGYVNPLTERYASAEMSAASLSRFKFETWRRLWLWLAEEERRLGLPIPEEAVTQMAAHLSDVDFQAAAVEESKTRHDVMAHVHVFGAADRRPGHHPLGRHLRLRHRQHRPHPDARRARARRKTPRRDAAQAARVRARAPRPARPRLHALPARTTHDRRQARDALGGRPAHGPRGSPGRRRGPAFPRRQGRDRDPGLLPAPLRRRLGEGRGARPRAGGPRGFARRQLVAGQTYSRKQDDRVVHALSGLAQSAHKIGSDLRLLQHEGELEEPFEKSQVGSSAMPYKRNPMRAERVCSLARHVIALSLDTAMTAATQWLERTLDDSANKRIAVPEAFLASDAILILLENVLGGLVVHPEVSARKLAAEAPFLATENLDGGRAPGRRPPGAPDERLRVHARASADARAATGAPADLFERLAGDAAFGLSPDELRAPPHRRSSSADRPSRWRRSSATSSTPRSRAPPPPRARPCACEHRAGLLPGLRSSSACCPPPARPRTRPTAPSRILSPPTPPRRGGPRKASRPGTAATTDSKESRRRRARSTTRRS